MGDFLPPAVLGYIPYGFGLIVLLIGLFIVRLIFRSAINRKVHSIGDMSGMSLMDVDQMRKKGLVSETEYKAIRHKLAEGELSKELRRQRVEKERALLAQVERNPEAARLLLSPEVQAAMAKPPAEQTPPTTQSTAPQAPSAKGGAAPGDLDLLLKKGAITPEEYRRLKSFFD